MRTADCRRRSLVSNSRTLRTSKRMSLLSSLRRGLWSVSTTVWQRLMSVFRDQDLSPQAQLDLGLYLGDGEIERHPQAAQVPIEGGGITLIWKAGRREQTEFTYRHPYADGSYGWHTDLVHERERLVDVANSSLSSGLHSFAPRFGARGWRRHALGIWNGIVRPLLTWIPKLA
jgi:hypothetical protein